jgi:hypothetical protein
MEELENECFYFLSKEYYYECIIDELKEEIKILKELNEEYKSKLREFTYCLSDDDYY